MAAFLIHVAIKSSLALIVTWMAACALRRRSAAARHLVWALGLLSTLALPVLGVIGPAWDLPVPVSQFNVDGVAAPVALQPAAAVVSEPPASSGAIARPADRPRLIVFPLWSALKWPNVLMDVWLLGALFALAQLVTGMVAIRARVSRAAVVTDPSWRADMHSAATSVGATGGVGLRMTDGTTIPLVCGLWRSTILLPVDAGRWSAERRRVVLVHELAHVARRDCMILALARFARALYWFNPLAHMAGARLRAEQERAADDMVLSAGTDASAYADHLLEIVRAFRTANVLEGAAVAMARPSEIEGRLMAILDDRRNRVPLSRAMRIGVGLAAMIALVPLAALQATGAPVESARPLGWQAIDIAPAAGPVVAAPTTPQNKTHVARAASPQQAVQRGATPAGSPPAPPTPGQTPIPAPPTPGTRVDLPPVPSTVDTETRRRVANALIVALDDSNERVRAQALSTLASMRDERAIPGLIKALSDSSVEMRVRAVDGLQQFDTQESVDALIKALSDSSPDVRERAATALGSVRNARAVAPLVQALKDANANVRRRAVSALGMLADPAAIDGLTLALKDADPAVREQAARSLGSIARGRPSVAFNGSSFSIDVSQVREMTAQATRDASRVLDEKRRELQSLQDRFVVPPAPPEPPPIPSVP